jgi:hypothetical protein
VKPYFGTDQEVLIGTPTVIEAMAPDGDFGAVFEDDGETGYFYALDFACGATPIVDAIHIYAVGSVKAVSVRAIHLEGLPSCGDDRGLDATGTCPRLRSWAQVFDRSLGALTDRGINAMR